MNKSIDVIATNKINATKNELKGEITEVNDRLDAALDDLEGVLGDGIIDEAESLIIADNINRLNKEKADVDARYDTIFNNDVLSGEIKDDLSIAKSSYDIKFDNIINVINTIIIDSNIDDNERLIYKAAVDEYNLSSSELVRNLEIAIDYIANVKVNEAKDDLQSNINDVINSVNDLEGTMNGAFQDGILSEAEKLSIKQHLKTLASEKSDIDKQYAALNINEHLVDTPKANLTGAYNGYVASYNSLIVVINDILNKTGLVDSVDQSNLDGAFSNHNAKLGIYTECASAAIDAIAQKKAEAESEKVDKKYAEILLTPDGIVSKVENMTHEINSEGGVKDRLQSAEQKITAEAIVSTVKDSNYGQGLESQIQQNANEINLTVKKDDVISSINQSAEGIKISASKVNITGFVTFSDLSGTGTTTINGSNIKTGTINASLANIININASNINTGTLNVSDYIKIKGTGTRVIDISKDNYAVYDGGTSDEYRKIVAGFRTVYGGYAPTLMLGYNGTGLHNDNTGETCLTVTHYPANNNPEGVNSSYGAFATRVNAAGNYSSLNMYQYGDVKLRSNGIQQFCVNNSNLKLQLGTSNAKFYYGSSNSETLDISSAGLSVTGAIWENGTVLANKYAQKTHTHTEYLSSSSPTVSGKLYLDSSICHVGYDSYYSAWGGSYFNTYGVKLNNALLIGHSSGNMHLVTSSGAKSTLYALISSTYSVPPEVLSDEIQTFSTETSALSLMNRTSVVDNKIIPNMTTFSNEVEEMDIEGNDILDECVKFVDVDVVEMNINNTVSMLWKAVQELKLENDDLKNKLTEIENSIV